MMIAAIVAAFVSYFIYSQCFTKRKKLPVKSHEAIFVTGCDSGMGEKSVEELLKQGYFVFAACYLDKTKERYKDNKRVCYVGPFDVTKRECITAAVKQVTQVCEEQKLSLFGVVQAAGIAIMAPIEYVPEHLFRQQIEVNLFGYIFVAQAFLPLVLAAVKQYPNRRGRFLWFGTGGGIPATSPGLISGYMTSKWGIEAFCQSMRQEMQLRKYPVDCLMINPGIVKPTGMESATLIMLENTWKKMPAIARQEYGHFVEQFTVFNQHQKGTHPSVVAAAVGDGIRVENPPLRYKVGFESKASTFVGLLPTSARDWLLNKSMFLHDLKPLH